MVVEGKEVTFRRDIYADVYVDILGLMVKCDTAPVHRAKTKVCRVEWANIGMWVNYFPQFYCNPKIFCLV